jgi:3-oxoadipate enol-lactonase
MPKITIDDISLYYELHGPETAPVLVLNNGVIMNAATSWGFQTQSLSQVYRVLQYDCRGQGQSDHPPGPYSMAQHADDLARLLDELCIASAHIAGISYGGEVAQAFALQYPAKTKSLILADTVSQVNADLRIVVEGWMEAAQAGDAQAFFDVTVPWNFSPQFIRANPGVLEDARKRYQDLDYPAIVSLCHCFLHVDFSARLKHIQAPACILYGEKDLLKGREYAHILHEGLPHSEMHVLRDAGHATCWERPEEFNTIVLGFLAKQKS